MTADVRGQIADLLDRLDAAREAATAGEWEQDYEYPSDVVVLAEGRDTIAAASDTFDAALTVAAVNAVGPLTAAVRAVLALHFPILEDLDSDPRCWEDGDRWPCPTVRALAAALLPDEATGPGEDAR